MSCCNLYSQGEDCDCRIPRSPDPKDGRIWCALSQSWIKFTDEGCHSPFCEDGECECKPESDAEKVVRLTRQLDHARTWLLRRAKLAVEYQQERDDARDSLVNATQFCFYEEKTDSHPLTTAYIYCEERERGAENWWILHGYRRNDDGSLYSFIEKAATQEAAIKLAKEILEAKKDVV